MKELTACQAKNVRSRSRPSASFQLQPPQENLLPAKPRAISFIPAAATMRELTFCHAKNARSRSRHQLHSSSSHHERTYPLPSQECQEHIKTISFILAPATMRELTNCKVNNATSISSVHNVPTNFVTMKKSCHTAPH
jgi:hypothetical protein